MNHFDYRDGELCAEAVPLAGIAEAVGTPFYCYSTATLVRHYRVFRDAFAGLDAGIYYSLKANSNLGVVRTLAVEGAGADVVSEGELRRALAAGIPAQRIVFSGVGKSGDELEFALAEGIYQFNVESEPELEVLNEIAVRRGVTAPVALRINPAVDAGSHRKISTGRTEDKFGVPWVRASQVCAQAATLPGIELVGIDVHIGSQLTDLAPFQAAFDRVVELVQTLRSEGHDIRRLDLGGGLGIAYDEGEPPLPADYAAMIRQTIGELECELMLEPGRVVAGNAGVLVSRVIYVKKGANRRFVILDAAMNDLLRPTLYEARHRILPVREAPAEAPVEPVDFVGPVCETGDTFAKDVPMTPLAAGDLVVICSAGAYGAVMASTYNSRLLVPEVLVKDDDFAVVRPRPSYAELLDQDAMPEWLALAPEAGARGAA
jgi:diaminopimelate decarboxylase